MGKYRILTLDGSSPSGGLGYISGGLLRSLGAQAKKKGKSLLKEVDVFAGTSAGTWNTLFFAMYKNPDDGLNDIIDFWQNVVYRMPAGEPKTVGLAREVCALLGQKAVVNTKPVRDFFIDYFGPRTKLGDLKQKVVITSFQLDNMDLRRRHWKPKIFNNLCANEPDNDELVVDVAMRSSSPPVIDPIFQSLRGVGSGFVDGGVFANNPAMVALAQALMEQKHGIANVQMSDIRLLSMGNGQSLQYVAPRYDDGIADWGYQPWVLDFKQPLALINLLMEANMQAATYQAEAVLGDSFFRADPETATRGAMMDADVAKVLAKQLAEPSTQELLKVTMGWLEASGWLETPLANIAAAEASAP